MGMFMNRHVRLCLLALGASLFVSACDTTTSTPSNSAVQTLAPTATAVAPTPTAAQLTPDPTIGWKTATNPAGRYTVSYPPDYTHLGCDARPGFPVGYVYQPAKGTLRCPVAESYPQLIDIRLDTTGAQYSPASPSSCLSTTSANLTIDDLPTVRTQEVATGPCAADPRNPSQTKTTTVTYRMTSRTTTWTISAYSVNGDTASLATFDLIAAHMRFTH